MSIAHLLDDFSAAPGGGDTLISMSDVSLEEARLAAFENGYKAGWDDAVKAQQGDSRRVSADFAANLQDLSFTYHEAQGGFLAELQPLLTGLVETVLPRLAHCTLGARVAEILQEKASEAAGAPITITTSPHDLAAIEAMTEGAADVPLRVVAEPSLGEGQVHISVGGGETEIDLTRVLEEIETAVRGFFDARDDAGPQEHADKESA